MHSISGLKRGWADISNIAQSGVLNPISWPVPEIVEGDSKMMNDNRKLFK